MNTSEVTKTPAANPLQNLFSSLRERVGGKNGLIAMAMLVIGGVLLLNWSWLVTAGVAPLILGVLPCVAMCALGLCANKIMGGKSSCSGSETPPKTAESSGPSAIEGARHTS